MYTAHDEDAFKRSTSLPRNDRGHVKCQTGKLRELQLSKVRAQSV